MHRLDIDSVDLIGELTRLKSKKTLPRQRDLIKAKKCGLTKYEEEFSTRFQHKIEEYLNHDDASGALRDCNITRALSEGIKEIYLYLDDLNCKKINFISSQLGEYLGRYISAPIQVINSQMYSVNDSLSDKLDLVSKTLKLIARMHNDLFEFNNDKIIEIDESGMISNLIHRYYSLLIQAKNYEEAKLYLKLDKELLNLWRNKYKDTYFGNLSRYYVALTELAFCMNDYNKAKKSAFKSIDANNRAINPLNYRFPLVLKECAQRAYVNKDYSESLLFSDLALEAIESTENILEHCGDEIQARYMSDTKRWKNELNKNKKYLAYIKNENKNKLGELNKEQLQKFSEKYNIKIEWMSVDSFSIKIDESIDNLKDLTRKLNTMNIVCYFNADECAIIFDSLFDINVICLKNTLLRWLNQIEFNKKSVLTNEIVELAEVFSCSSTSSDKEIASFSGMSAAEGKKEKKDKAERSNNVEKIPSTITENINNDVISWGIDYPVYSKKTTSEVYKLYGATSHNQYLFINHGFFERLNIESPGAARTLVNICERGKVINNSQGNKGIIIEGKDVKIKDASKSYRFFGQVVSATKHKDKACQLIEINYWHSDPH